MGTLRITDLHIVYDQKTIINKLSLLVNTGEIVSILGPSGVGKTSILKAIAGLLKPAQGDIYLNDLRITDTPAEKRHIVLMFQQPLLFPHLTVQENVAFGLRMRGRIDDTEKQRIREFLSHVQLVGYEFRRPHELSGGQQQRVALARALITAPSILLLDEPLSSLDSTLRREMRDLIKKLQRKLGMTMLFVTHDQSEALTLSDQVALLLDGSIRQYSSSQDMVYRPVDFQVAEFFGNLNQISGVVQNNILQSPVGCFELPPPIRHQNTARATIRPEHICMSPNSNGVPAVIEEIQFEGSSTRVTLAVENTRFIWQTHEVGLAVGQRIHIQFPQDKVWFPLKQKGE
jgi:ABC-type Fe3+/spermidine/putrescine transport system ATPase subunit